MPYKLNEPHRDKIPKAKYRVTNWSEYDRSLVQRGDVRFWIDEEVISDWIAPWRKGPGGQRRYSNTAIVATLTLGSVYRLPLRQAEGFVRSLFALMDVEIPVPDHTTLARRHRHRPRSPAGYCLPSQRPAARPLPHPKCRCPSIHGQRSRMSPGQSRHAVCARPGAVRHVSGDPIPRPIEFQTGTIQHNVYGLGMRVSGALIPRCCCRDNEIHQNLIRRICT